jgi:hypothetical protein
MGWLVQAEAPPGPLLRKFRQVILSGKASERDLAFYFVHWFTDLAGGEPHPQEGCEKFVLKFPRHVLNQFLSSFEIVQKLGNAKASESNVFEDYVNWRFASHIPPLGKPLRGRGAMAKMRLVMMAQGDSEALLKAFNDLSEADSDVISEEMALTGCKDQIFDCERNGDANWTGSAGSKGPAFLIYYGPALMQRAGRQDPTKAMNILAEVFRQARSIWPLTPKQVNETVTVRIDGLKELDVGELQKETSNVWVLAKQSTNYAVVQSMPVSSMSSIDWSTARIISMKAVFEDTDRYMYRQPSSDSF